MVLAFEHFIASLFVHCCCFLVWTSGSPLLKASLQSNRNNSFIQRTSSEETGREAVKSLVTPELQETSQSYSDEYFLAKNGDNVPVNPSSDDVELKQTVKRHAPKNIRVPQYMMDIYTHLQDKKWVPKFDIARSYYSVRNEVYTHPKNGEDKKSRFYGAVEEHHTFHFNISTIPRTEKIEFAQLRLYTKNNDGSFHRFGNRSRISLFWEASDTKVQLIASRNIQNPKNSCITFNITEILSLWFGNPELQQRLKVYVQNIEHPFSSEARADVSAQQKIDDEYQILVFSSQVVQASNITRQSKIRKRRAVKFGERFPIGMNEPSLGRYWEQDWNGLIGHVINKRSGDEDEEAEEMSGYIVEELGTVRKGKMKKKKNLCSRRPLHVNFASINYYRKVIAPAGYEAFECAGRCTFPMGAHLTPTEHAIIQTLVHGLEPKGVARACCVPTKLDPISVLYVDDNGAVTYKYEYGDMVVAECGCR